MGIPLIACLTRESRREYQSARDGMHPWVDFLKRNESNKTNYLATTAFETRELVPTDNLTM